MKTIYQPEYEALLQQLIMARKQAKLTQQQVADKLAKPQSYIAKIEGKERKIDVIEFMEICQILDIKASDIIRILEK